MQSPHHLTICKFFYIVLTAIMYNPRMKVSTSGSPLSHNNSWASDDHQSVLKAAVLECLLNAISAEILEDEPCWIFRSAAQLRGDRATFLRSFGKQVSVMRILNSALLLVPSINFVFWAPAKCWPWSFAGITWFAVLVCPILQTENSILFSFQQQRSLNVQSRQLRFVGIVPPEPSSPTTAAQGPLFKSLKMTQAHWNFHKNKNDRNERNNFSRGGKIFFKKIVSTSNCFDFDIQINGEKIFLKIFPLKFFQPKFFWSG